MDNLQSLKKSCGSNTSKPEWEQTVVASRVKTHALYMYVGSAVYISGLVVLALRSG